MLFALLFLSFFLFKTSENANAVKGTTASNKYFIGMEEWQQHDLDLCEVPGRLNESLFCYTHVFNYQRLDVEVLSEDPILIVYRNFAPRNFVADFISDARRRIFTTQEVVDRTQNKQDVYTKRPSRIVSGAWIEHEDTISIARMFRFLKTMLPFVNVDNSEMWQVLSYHPGHHYAPHYDYIPEQYDSFVKKIGNRFATFLLMLQPAVKGGGTVFPDLQTTVMLSAGDAVFWTNMEANGEVEPNSIHGGCVVWEGEKLATVLWIRANHQELLRSPRRDGRIDIDKLIRPR